MSAFATTIMARAARSASPIRCATLPIAEAFFAAASEAGIPLNPDFNGARQEGVGYYQVTQKDARRSSAATGYLRPALRRANLTVTRERLVTAHPGREGPCRGRRDRSRGGSRSLRAQREVILPAGAIGSPRLLLLSGIGPADHLKSRGRRASS